MFIPFLSSRWCPIRKYLESSRIVEHPHLSSVGIGTSSVLRKPSIKT